MHRIYATTAIINTSPRSHLQLDVNMTVTQKRDAIYTLLGTMPEPEACGWLQSEFPAWFKPESAVTDALRWALEQIEDDLDPDHQAALAAAWATLNSATGEGA
jgi:hypothetical protein